MSWLFLIFFTFLPFSPWIFRRVDLWKGAGQYCQIGILFIFCYSFFENSEIKIKNFPLTALALWITGLSAYIWYQALVIEKVNILIALFYLNFLLLLIFYKCSFYLTRRNIEKILTFLSYSLCVYLLYCVLEYFNLDQFFVPELGTHHIMTGFLGNPGHNAAFLGMCLPIFYLNKSRLFLLCACLLWVILGIIGSATGLITAFIVTIFFTIFYRLPKWYYVFLLLGLGFVIWKFDPSFFNLYGRLDVWKRLYPIIQESSLVGRGLGYMNVLGQTKQFLRWHHAHNEFLQSIITIGIIGFLAVIWCIWDYFRLMLKDRTSVVLASCFLGFLVGCMAYFPAHLWIPGMIGLMSYSFMYVLRSDDKKIGEILC